MIFKVLTQPTWFLCGVLLLLIFASCATDNDDSTLPDGSGHTRVTFTLQSPGASVPQSRAITLEQENEVQTIDILVFKPNGGSYVYTARCDEEDITTGSDTRLKTFTITLRQGDFDLVVLANARGLYTPASFQGLSKADALSTLEAALPVGGKWLANGSVPFPMWGDVGNITIDDQTDLTGTGSVNITRMMARVDVNIAGMAATTFQLTSVDVYNYNTSGTLVPDMEAWDTISDPDKPKATAPNVPASSALTLGPVEYIGAEINTEGNNCVREIYLFEAENHTGGLHQTPKGLQQRTCLVIGGIWDANGNGDFSDDGAPTYYRVDFSSGSGTTQHFIDVLRNHLYVFNITKVSGYGYEDSHTAFISGPINIESEVEAWNETDMNDIESDGRFQLTVDKSSFYFFDEGRGQPLKIYTDHPNGWKIDEATKPDWITVTPNNDNSGASSQVTVSASRILSPTPNRQSSFWIVAGNLYKEIKVEQVNEPELTIEVSPLQVVFRKSGSNPKAITVKVYPENSMVYFIETGPNRISSWARFPVDGLQQVTSYEFQPNLNSSGNLLTSFVTVYITDAEGNSVSQQVTVRQLAHDLIFEVTGHTDTYPAVGGSEFFKVESASDWRFYEVAEPAGQSQLVTNWSSAVNPPNEAPVTYSFTLTPNNTWNYRTATFRVSSSDVDFAGRDVEIRQSRVNPSLTLNNTTLDFAATTATTPQSRTVKSNAKWRYTSSGQWSEVIATATPAAGGVSGVSSPQSPIETPVSFTPKAYPAQNGIPAAGTSYTAYADFATTDHSDANTATGRLTLKRTVPTYFKLNTGNTTIGRAGGNLGVSVSTNAAWNATPSSGTGTGNQSPTTYGTRSVNVNISGNGSWSDGATPTNRTVVVTAKYGTTTGAVTTAGGTFNVTQPGYYVSGGTISATSVSREGGSVTVRLNGEYPATKIRRVAGSETTDFNIGAGTPASPASTTVTIPENKTWSTTNRSVAISYLHNGTTYKSVGSVSQPGCFVTSGSAVSNSLPVAAQGTIRVRIKGNFPALPVRGISGSTTFPEATFAKGTEVEGNVTITANSNWSSRTITLQYKNTGNSQWYTIPGLSTYTQAGFTLGTPTPPTSIAGGGQTVTVSFPGANFTGGTLSVRAWDVTANRELVSAQGVNSSTKAATLTIPHNDTGAPRTIRFQYWRGNHDTAWQNINPTVSQPKGNELTNDNRLWALETAKSEGLTGSSTMSWAVAMGIDTKYNSEFYYTSYSGGTTDNLNYTPNKDTGCNAYWEGSPTDPKSGKGKWRVPRYSELQTSVYMMPSAGYYWTSKESARNEVYGRHRNTSGSSQWIYDRSKSSSSNVRCVRAK